MLFCSHACATLTCCFSTRFFTPSITNWEPVFITLEKRLVGEREGKGGGGRPGLGWCFQASDEMKGGVMKEVCCSDHLTPSASLRCCRSWPGWRPSW